MIEALKVGTDYSGVGAPEQALKELKILHTVEFACDKDKYARTTYLANHEARIMYDDITTRNNTEAPAVDLYCFGFPCQAFSLSGLRKGFDDIRGTLIFNSAEYIKHHRPRYFIAENVKGLLSHDKPKKSKAKFGRTFSTILNLFAKTVNGQILMPMYEDNLGYHVFYAVLNSKYYDVPQNRERVFIVGIRDDVDANFVFPSSKVVTKKLADVLEVQADKKYFLSDKMVNWLISHSAKKQAEGAGFKFELKKKEGIASAITIKGARGITDNYIEDAFCVAVRGRGEKGDLVQTIEARGDGITNTTQVKDNFVVLNESMDADVKIIGETTPGSQGGKIFQTDGLFPTVTAGTHGYALGYISDEPPATEEIIKKIRQLTPLECFRLQGFPDTFIKPCSDTQLYKQAGNSMTVKVMKAILKNLLIKN